MPYGEYDMLIDANVILEFLLGQQRQDESLSLLKLTSTGSVTGERSLEMPLTAIMRTS